ncbi:MAG TPA: hypothetical protein VN607_05020 [Gemmatimonadaceae bacterium]|nr:hypothetical protein [Gemmatimonadaceae bacterium]
MKIYLTPIECQYEGDRRRDGRATTTDTRSETASPPFRCVVTASRIARVFASTRYPRRDHRIGEADHPHVAPRHRVATHHAQRVVLEIPVDLGEQRDHDGHRRTLTVFFQQSILTIIAALGAEAVERSAVIRSICVD